MDSRFDSDKGDLVYQTTKLLTFLSEREDYIMSNAEAKIMNPEKAPITATVTRNLEHNGLEITFSGVPSAKIRTSLKSNGFHWHNSKQIWYAKYNDKHVDFIKSMKWELPEEEPEDEPEVDELEEGVDLELALARIAELEAELAKYKKPAKVTKSDKTDTAIINRIVKGEGFRNVNKFSGGYVFTEGHYLVTDSDSHGYESVDCPPLLETVISDIKNTDKNISVDLESLKALAKVRTKDKKPYVIQSGKTIIKVNPRFLLDCLTWCGMSEVMIDTSSDRKIVYVKSETRLALCLPIR